MDEALPQNQMQQTLVRRVPQARPQEQDKESKQRVKLWMAGILLVTAISIDAFLSLLDLTGIGEFVNWMINPIVDFMFVIWFWCLGVSFTSNTKRLASMLMTALVGLIPLLNTLPELTLGILGVILITRAEDGSDVLGIISKGKGDPIIGEKSSKVFGRVFQKQQEWSAAAEEKNRKKSGYRGINERSNDELNSDNYNTLDLRNSKKDKNLSLGNDDESIGNTAYDRPEN